MQVYLYSNRETEESFLVDRVFKYIIDIITALILVLFFIFVVAKIYPVRGNSMSPTIRNNDHVFVNTIAYRFEKPKADSIIAYEDDEGSIHFQRIVAVGGDKVQIKGGNIFVNGEMYTGLDINGNLVYAGDYAKEKTIETGRYFVIGDNYNASTDSRFLEVGQIAESRIIGCPWFVIYPFSSIGLVK